MKKSKACFYGLLLVALASSCTKESSTLPVSAAEIQSATSVENASTSGTVFGLLAQEKSITETEQKMIKAGIKLVRAQVLFSKTTSSKAVDQYLKDGFDVQINFNYQSTNTPGLFPTDTVMIRQQAEQFFKYYLPYKEHIPIVAVENEWNNELYRDFTKTTIQDYLTELAIITEVGHKYGFKIADAGFSSTGLQRWMYSQLSGIAALKWLTNHYVGLDKNYEGFLKLANTYIEGVKKINIDYCNVHWYNIKTCNNDFVQASQTYRKACNKKVVISNEFGVREGGHSLFQKTVDEIRNNVPFALAYSGVNEPGRAIELTDEMLSNF